MIVIQLNVITINPAEQKPTAFVCQSCGWTGQLPFINAQHCPHCEKETVAQLYNQPYIPQQFTMEWIG